MAEIPRVGHFAMTPDNLKKSVGFESEFSNFSIEVWPWAGGKSSKGPRNSPRL